MKIIGHRGNTLKDLKEALKHKVDEIEFDVRVTSDDIPVLYHDSQFLTAKGEKLKIAGSTLKLLKKNKPSLTTLRELFEAVDPETSLYIEIKPGVRTGPIIKALKDQLKKGRPAKNMRIASFSQRILKDVHSSLPELPKIINETWRRGKARKRADAVATKAISMSHKWMHKSMIKKMKKRGYELHAYTLNNPVRAAKFHAHGLVGAITDFPARFKKKH